MGLTLGNFKWPVWTRTKAGENFIDLTSHAEWSQARENLRMAMEHPILTPAILFVAKLFSQAEFTVERKSTGKTTNNNFLLELLENPNPFQTKQDFLETLMFVQLSQGCAVAALNRIIGFSEPKSMTILDYSKIEWPKDIDLQKYVTGNKSVMKKSIVYDKGGLNQVYKLEDLLFFYDLPNGIGKNPFKVESRLDGFKQTLLNTHDSLVAKNIIVKSNGKELFTTTKKGFALTPQEKKDIQNLYNQKYGLAFDRKRGIVTKADVNWKSLHIALRDLGLDESTKVDGNIIYTGLHIPKDILSLEAKKTTYNNFKESMVSYLQNEIQPSADSMCAVFNKKFDGAYKLKASYEHMPIMQFILIERYKGVEQRAKALHALRAAGLPDALALELVGLESTTQLNPLQMNQNEGQGEGESQEDKRRFRDSILEAVGSN